MYIIFADKNNKKLIKDCLNNNLKFQMFFTEDKSKLEYIIKFNRNAVIISFNEAVNSFLKGKKIKYGTLSMVAKKG